MSTLTDPDTDRKRNPVKEVAHHSKGCLAVLLAVLILGIGGYVAYSKGHAWIKSLGEVPDFTGNGKTAVSVQIPGGTSVTGIGEILVDKKVIASTKAWKEVVKAEPMATSIQAGTYAMKTELPASKAMAILLNPAKYRIRTQATVREGLNLDQQVADLVKGSKIPKKEFDAALKSPDKLGLPAYAKGNPEGVLFPQTYEVTDSTTATSLLKSMSRQYASVTKQMNFDARAKGNGVNAYQALIIASIIEREAIRDEDRPKVARVIYNRLDIGMMLQMDSTVHYAVNDYSKVTITPAQMANPSPYNTYKHKGLPPGPIAAPGQASLEAAVSPVAGDWLFFVTVNPDTGETKFAKTQAEHDQYVQEFHAWCQSHKGKC